VGERQAEIESGQAAHTPTHVTESERRLSKFQRVCVRVRVCVCVCVCVCVRVHECCFVFFTMAKALNETPQRKESMLR
jgi:hypothetical protein